MTIISKSKETLHINAIKLMKTNDFLSVAVISCILQFGCHSHLLDFTTSNLILVMTAGKSNFNSITLYPTNLQR